ncbi:MAG: serine hydrolase [Ginsengibacter sp.]
MFIFSSIVSCYPIRQTQTSNALIISSQTLKPAVKPNSDDESKTDIFFTDLFKKYPQFFDSIISRAKDRNIQIIYTQIDRGPNNMPRFKDYNFNVDTEKYFYPASTVKLPVAILALQRLNELKTTGISMNTTMITDAAYSGQTPSYNDPNTADGKPNIKQYIKRIFLVSDNDAFNRLYEFLGQQYINDELDKRGYANAQVLHRLDIFLSEDENRHTNPVKFLADNNTVLYQQPLVFNPEKYAPRIDSLGSAFYKGDSLVLTPMNFSKKNRITLPDLHSILRSLIFPNSVAESKRFNLTADDYNFIYKNMSAYPGESIYPAYDTAIYSDAYLKFLMYGGEDKHLPKKIRIFNKSGEAYGQLTDIAYIVDFDKNIEFFLSATINCTRNGIINNDDYDYDTAGYPFLKNLGKVIYNFELSRKRSRVPDLSPFKIVYEK